MPTKPMKIHAQFPTFDQQSEEIKSLINFFMENASVFFHGNYDDPSVPNKMTSYTGEIRFNNRPLEDSYADYTPYEMVIPYQNYFTSDFPTFDVAPQADLSSSTLPYVVDNDPIPVVDGVTNYEVDSLTSVKTAMNLYQGDYGDTSGGSPYFPVSQFTVTNTISLPVQIIPKVNDVANVDTKLKPKQIATHQANADGLYLQKIPIEDILDSEGNPIAEGFVYDFQLRTPTFGLKDDSLVGSSIESVFYKVGITRLDTTVGLDAIVEALKLASLKIHVLSPSADDRYAQFALVLAEDHTSSPSYRLFPEYNSIEQHIGLGDINGIATRAVLALRNSSDDVKALVYIKLYNEDGSDYTSIIDHKDFGVYESSSSSSTSSDLYLDLTDQNIDPVSEP